MKKLLATLLFVVSAFSHAEIVSIPIPGAPGLSVTVGTGINALPLQDIRNTPGATNITMGDDDWRSVPLQFNFPYFGQNFNRSWMLSNGAVTFQDPAQNAWGMCCSGMNLSTLTDTRYNYTIFPLWTDLIANGGSHWTKGTATSQTYGWYGVAEFYNNNRSSFEVDINSSGVINTRIGGALVTNHHVTSGMTGDLSKGEYYQYYHGYGINIPNGSGISWSALGGTGSVDQCIINPLYNPSCPGYADAYKAQQCSISALYDPTCPGYQQAYFDQQCSANPLYNQNCPGYQQAYFTQQCTANPLYSVDCPGYQQAYFNQQCSLSALYSPSCPGYDVAYQAFLFNQACTANPQSSPRCPGYVTPVVSTTTTTTTTTSSSSTTPQLVSDPVVNQTITTTSTTTAPTAPAAPVQLTTSPTSTTQTTTALVVESAQSSSTSSSSSTPSTSTGSTGSTGSTTTTQSPRQTLQQARMEAAKKEAAAKGNEAVKEGGEAKSMNAQIATQGLVIAAMGYNPSFDVYQTVVMKDVSFYKPFIIYGGQKNVDNARVGRRLFGATDQLHNQMVQSQYELGK
jgi:hypothetical protein